MLKKVIRVASLSNLIRVLIRTDSRKPPSLSLHMHRGVHVVHSRKIAVCKPGRERSLGSLDSWHLDWTLILDFSESGPARNGFQLLKPLSLCSFVTAVRAMLWAILIHSLPLTQSVPPTSAPNSLCSSERLFIFYVLFSNSGSCLHL